MKPEINVIVVEDEPLAAQGIISYIQEISFFNFTGHYTNAIEANEALKKETVDIMFLDIQMPKITGIDFLRTIKNPPIIVITTAYPNYALEGFELDVLDYLIKPYPFDRFLKAANKAHEMFLLKSGKSAIKPQENINDSYFFVKTDKKLEKVKLEDILFVEAMENYVIIHSSGKKLITMMTMKSLEKSLPEDLFLRIHKSFIVNKGRVETVEGGMMKVGSVNLPISRQKRSVVLDEIVNKWML